MYPFSAKCKTYIIDATSPEAVRAAILAFPDRYTNHRAKDRYWQCKLISRSTDDITLQLIDPSFEPPRGNVKKRDVPYFRLRFSQASGGIILHRSYSWQVWKRLFAALFCAVQLAALIYVVLCFATLSTRSILFFVTLWTPITALLIYWLLTNYRHDALTVQVFDSLIDKNFSGI